MGDNWDDGNTDAWENDSWEDDPGLSEGSLMNMLNGKKLDSVVLQFLGSRVQSVGFGVHRYVRLNDGLHSFYHAICPLGSELDQQLENNLFPDYSTVVIDEYYCSTEQSENGKEQRVLVIVRMTGLDEPFTDGVFGGPDAIEYVGMPNEHSRHFVNPRERDQLLNEIRDKSGAIIQPEALSPGSSWRLFRLVGPVENVHLARNLIRTELCRLEPASVNVSVATKKSRQKPVTLVKSVTKTVASRPAAAAVTSVPKVKQPKPSTKLFTSTVNVSVGMLNEIGPDGFNRELQAARRFPGVSSITKTAKHEDYQQYLITGTAEDAVRSAGDAINLRMMEETVVVPRDHFHSFTENGHALLNDIRYEMNVVITPGASDATGKPLRIVGLSVDVRRAVARITAEVSRLQVVHTLGTALSMMTVALNGTPSVSGVVSAAPVRRSTQNPLSSQPSSHVQRMKAPTAPAALQNVVGRAEQNKKEDSECIICSDAVITTAFIPCGHRNFCDPCAKAAFQVKKECPTCRAACTQVVRIFG